MTKAKNAQNATATVSSSDSMTEQLIPLNRLKKSPRNARKTPHPAEDIEALAASIAAHGMLQAPVVEPEMQDEKPTGNYLVTIGEGRRQAQLLRVKRKEIAKYQPIRCLIETAHDAFEISLAENAVRSPMHPADQFEAFHQLHSEKGQSVEDIAARFGVTPAVVRQRLKLASISPRLMQAYRDGELTLDLLTAFAITDDHARQEKVFENLAPFADRDDIVAELNQEHLAASDPRAVFVGKQAYVEAGGAILNDLFDQESDGYFTDPGLLADLAAKKLEAAAAEIKAEGWKWVETLPRFDYGAVEGCRRIYPSERPLSDAEQEELTALEDQYAALEIDNDSEEACAEADRLMDAIDALRVETYQPEAIARAGAIVTISHDGTLRIERGYLRPEDDPRRETSRESDNKEDGPAPLPGSLVSELTAYRTSALRNALSQDNAVALRAVLHALATQAFYERDGVPICLGLRLVTPYLERYAPGIGESETEMAVTARHERWGGRLPADPGDLWQALSRLSLDEQLDLLAHCASLSLDCVQQPKQTANPASVSIAEAIGFDMAAHWSPTPANYLGRVSKDRILEAVREGVSKEAAENLAGLKKNALAVAAAERLAGKGWLPALLRNPEPAAPPAEAAAA